VDHHRTNPLFGTVNLVDGAASSTSELVYRLLQEMGAPIDAETATALLFGVVGDTGSFRNGATTPGSLQTAAELVRLGGEIQRIAYALFEAKRFAAARLWGLVVSSIQLDGGRRIVYGFVTQEMLHREGATSDETEGIVEYLRGIEEARIAALLKENEGGDVRVSLRSGADVDVSLIAKALGGGGHQQAAGCTLPGPLPAARAAIDAAYDTLHLG
jgi:phosphoesterase RecJ-like protein